MTFGPKHLRRTVLRSKRLRCCALRARRSWLGFDHNYGYLQMEDDGGWVLLWL